MNVIKKNRRLQMKRHCFLLCLLSFVATVYAAGGLRGSSALAGGWSPIKNLKDPHVVEIANYAVSEYNNRSKTDLKLESVVKGETQAVAGTNYRLVLGVNGGGASKKYEAVVWEKPWAHFRNLTSFKPVDS